ncbi:hypothetical protein KCU99_g7370, partial [Aureobasidium melanogenum]
MTEKRLKAAPGSVRGQYVRAACETCKKRKTKTELSNEATGISNRNPDSAAGPALRCSTPDDPVSRAQSAFHSAKRQPPGISTTPREDGDSLKAWQATVDRRLEVLERSIRQGSTSDSLSHHVFAATADCDASSPLGSDDLPESRVYSQPAVYQIERPQDLHRQVRVRKGGQNLTSGLLNLVLVQDPCLSDLETVLDQDNGESLGSNTLHFAALVKMMQATVRILEELHPNQSSLPGWQEYQEAVHLTTRLKPPNRPTIAAIQFAIAKTIYETLCDMLSTAYDTLASCVRMCYQLRLNSQPSNLDLAPGQDHIARKIMCSIYCLDKDISRFLEIPCILRDCDLKIPLTQQLSIADQYSPISTSSSSSRPDHNSTHLEALVQWSVLSSEIWDRVASASAAKPTSPDVVAVMDDRLVILYQSLPSKFQWSKNMLAAVDNFSAKQALFFYLVNLDLHI